MKALYGAEIELGHSLFDYQTVAEDREKAKRNIDRALAGERVVEMDYSGEEGMARRYFEILHNPIIAEDGAVTGVVMVAHDITARKQAEEMLRQSEGKHKQLVEQASEGIFTVDRNGRYLDVNPAGLAMVGYRLEELREMTVTDLMIPEELEKEPSRFSELLSGKTIISERTLRRKDGSRFLAEITAKLMPDGTVLATKRDITGAVALRKAREYFTVVTAHELRTPMTMLKLLHSLIEGKRGGTLEPHDIDRVARVLGEACGALDGIAASTAIIADLHWSRRGTDFANVYLRIELNAVLGIAGNMLKKEKRDVRLTADLDGWPRNLAMRGNQAMLSRMMDNILSNAIKYTPDGKGVRVTAKRETGFAVLEVSDEGIGIPGDKMRAIFEPYFALENVNHHSTGKYKFMGGGIGLGLTVSRLIMEYHGGSLTIDSPGENKGTNVTLRFPLAGAEQAGRLAEKAPPVEDW